jgi:antitoxin MazE
MRARIRRWGNSLALRIPKAFAEEASLEDESVVDMKVVNGKLVVASVAEPDVTLDQLLADVEERNLHGEISTGRPVKTEKR